MEEIKAKLLAKGVSNSSAELYLNNMRRLNDGKPFTNLNFIKNVDDIQSRIKHLKPTTQRTYITSIVSILKQEPKYKKQFDIYYNMMMSFNTSIKATSNTKSDTQQQNWISQADVLDVYHKVADTAKSVLTSKKLLPPEYNAVLRWMVLSLYTLQPPRRNKDYQWMLVGKGPMDDTEHNYLDTKKWLFHFNNYKTKGTYSSQTQSIPIDLRAVITAYLKVHPLRTEMKTGMVPFLVKSDGDSLSGINDITYCLNRIFGRKIGVSMLRNIYLTDKYSSKVNEMDMDATAMGTSSNTIESNYVKIDNK